MLNQAQFGWQDSSTRPGSETKRAPRGTLEVIPHGGRYGIDTINHLNVSSPESPIADVRVASTPDAYRTPFRARVAAQGVASRLQGMEGQHSTESSVESAVTRHTRKLGASAEITSREWDD